MAPKRRRSPLPALLPTATRDDVVEWLIAIGLTKAAVSKLEQRWHSDHELVDGSTILSADMDLLLELGCTRAMATTILASCEGQQDQPGLTTQALAPTTQPLHGDAANHQQQQQQPEGGNREQQQQEQHPGQRERPRRTLATQPTQATQLTQPSQQVLVKPDPEQAEEDAAAWQAQQDRQQQQITLKREPRTGGGDAEMGDVEEEADEGQRQQQQQGEDSDGDQADEEEEEAAEEDEGHGEDDEATDAEEDAPPRRRRRLVKEEPAQGDSQTLAGRRGTRSSGALQADKQQRQPQQGEEDAEAEAGPSSGGTRILTRRRQQAAQEQEQRRELRQRTMQERQRRDEADEAARTDDEEDEQQPGEQQQQQQDEDEGDEWGPLVTEDLGPPAPSGTYARDWVTRAWSGMVEIFSLMSVEQLTELVEGQEEWPERCRNVLRKKKRIEGDSTWVDLTKSKQIAPRLANFILTGHEEGKEDDGMHKPGIKDLLREYCDGAVTAYVEGVLKLRYQNLPRIGDAHKLMWHLWHFPQGEANGVIEALLGSRQMAYETVTGDGLEPNEANFVGWKRVWQALENGRLTLVDQAQLDDWLIHVNDLSTHPRAKVVCRLHRQPGNKKLIVYVFQIFTRTHLSSSLISGTWKTKDPDNDQEILQSFDMHYILGGLDGVDGTPFMDAMDRLVAESRATEDEVTAKGVPNDLPLDTPMNLKQFDKVMACVEDLDRGEPEGFRQECNQAFLLTLRPYQRRSLAHMLREELAVAGSSRHLWVKFNLPENPELHCYVSPILHQIRTSTSKVEAEQWVHANGGAGWIALQMGMGKTACAVGAIQMNPPPDGWRKNRAYQTLRARDHLSAVINNMPHGGTLIVMPPTLIDQWEEEVRKTTEEELTILKWTENLRGNPRTQDCKEIAKYDIVLTTFQNALSLHTLSHIRWWRMIVDEPQLNAGGFLGDSKHPWFANHRWLLTGTPVNATVDSMGPSLHFLKLGGSTFDTLYKHFPPIIAHVLKRFMVRYTKLGILDGETNLQLPALTEHLIECDLSPVDKGWYRSLQADLRNAFAALLAKSRVDPNCVGAEDPNWEFSENAKKVKKQMVKMRGMMTKLRQAASSALKQPTGQQVYDDVKDTMVDEKHWYQSKAEAVIEVLEDKDPEEKVLVFSEFPDTLRAIKSMLPSIGLQSRDLLAGTSASRGKAIRQFQTDPPTKVFLLPYRAGGAGITLTAGTHIILCEPTLNPSFERQAIGRSLRMGQDKAVTVSRLLMRGTIEPQIAKFTQRLTTAEEEEPEDQLESTAMEANLAANDGSDKLTIEDLRNFVYKGPTEEEDEEDDE